MGVPTPKKIVDHQEPKLVLPQETLNLWSCVLCERIEIKKREIGGGFLASWTLSSDYACIPGSVCLSVSGLVCPSVCAWSGPANSSRTPEWKTTQKPLLSLLAFCGSLSVYLFLSLYTSLNIYV